MVDERDFIITENPEKDLNYAVSLLKECYKMLRVCKKKTKKEWVDCGCLHCRVELFLFLFQQGI